MKIIDFAKKGNLVRFFIGKNECEDYWGDDWNDAPYDLNAEEVYDSFVSGWVDVAFPFDWTILEPCDGTSNCGYSKEDMKKRAVPCLVIVCNEDVWAWDFQREACDDRNIKVYFGDHVVLTGPIDKMTLYGGVIVGKNGTIV